MEINSQMETTDVTMKGWVDIKKCLPLMRRKLDAEIKTVDEEKIERVTT